MRKLLLSLFAISFLFLGNVAHAESSASAYDSKFWSQQVFVQAYNNNASTIAINNVVVLDTTQTVNPNNYLGNYVTLNGSTTDSVYVFGVTDESITSGTLGRICIRGPHKVVVPLVVPTAGDIYGACSSTGSNAGKACSVTTASGTDRGFLGKILSNTASTDTGDAANTYWAWIELGVAN